VAGAVASAEGEAVCGAGEVAAIGIDVGYSPSGATSAISFFSVARQEESWVVEIVGRTRVLSTTDLIQVINTNGAFACARVVAVDAPLTPTRILAKPGQGRAIDSRFSRGAFSNGNGHRGLQPGSIATPIPGWHLYEAGMGLLPHLRGRGLSYFPFPATPPKGGVVALPERQVLEVIPKFTQGLLVERGVVSQRPREGGYRQIDDWVFPQVFVTAPMSGPMTVDPAYPPHGNMHARALELMAPVRLGRDCLAEANRIHSLPAGERHEALAAFVCGFQAALALVGGACLVGCVGPSEGYFLLPSRWHQEWERAWQDTSRHGDVVCRIPVALFSTGDLSVSRG
jgi:hypothetical protein